MSQNYLISIIIPIYNAETYLPDTINSIINQTIGFENIELILVDDKSTDNSKNIIKKYAEEYSNIKPIYLSKNSGYPGFVRNKGMEIVTSDYLMFIDSDDEYENDMCEILYNTLIENNTDCVKCNHNRIDDFSNYKPLNSNNINKKIILKPEDAIYTLDSVVWNKIFKTSIIKNNNIKFITDRMGEDTFFCLEYCLNSKSITYLNEYYGYKYYDRSGSFSTTNLKWNLDLINHYYEKIEILDKYNVNYDLNRLFNSSIDYSISTAIQMIENDWSSIYTLLYELYLFEQKIKFNNNKERTFLYRIINKLIMTNHISMATAIVFILNRMRKIPLIVKLYRKIIK